MYLAKRIPSEVAKAPSPQGDKGLWPKSAGQTEIHILMSIYIHICHVSMSVLLLLAGAPGLDI